MSNKYIIISVQHSILWEFNNKSYNKLFTKRYFNKVYEFINVFCGVHKKIDIWEDQIGNL